VQTPSDTAYQFGQFEVNPASGELFKNGKRVRLQEQPFRLLVVLLENAGEVVTREDLRSRIWKEDTFVDFDGSLRVAVRKLREALDDDAEKPRFVETIPRRGYRFIAPEIFTESAHGIGELGASPSSAETAAPDEGRIGAPLVHRSNWSRRWMLASVLLLIVVAGIAIAFRTFRQQRPQEQGALTVIPFTASPGVATSPAFSPDGSRIAFAWNGDPKGAAKGFDLYVKALGSETLLRLTQHPSESISPTWSPDGTQIAFQRLAGADSGIFVVPALGGPERKLRPTRMPTTNFNFFSWHNFTLISWSPDDKWIAFVDGAPGEELTSHARIYLLSTETLETKQVPISPKCVGEGLPAFSHNGEYLAYWCFLGENGEAVLYSLPVRGGQPKTISPSRASPRGLTWSADDERLIYSLNSLGSGLANELSEVTVANGSTKRLAFAGGAELPTVSPKGDKLAYSSLSTSVSIWRRDLLHLESPAVELIPSSRAQFDAQYSPDGKRIAFASHRSGIQGVWISADDGSNLVQISNPHADSGSPQWSPDGKKIAFDSRPRDRWEIYVADVAEGKPRKLVTNISDVVRPHWSRDEKWLYFTAREPGRMGVYRCPPSGGDAVLVAKGIDAINPREALDGKTVYFASDHDKSTLRKVSLLALPGTASEVDGLPRVSHGGVWALSTGGIYFVPAEAPRSLRYFDFATRQIRPIFEVDKDFGSGLSVSPDGRWISYSLVDVNSDIMLVDHFH
jgi:Tol biopolymer transport system component/DNA-binding winged helix-turn-helix (wHTH) protein